MTDWVQAGQAFVVFAIGVWVVDLGIATLMRATRATHEGVDRD